MDAARASEVLGPQPDKLTPGERIRLWRERAHLTQKALASDVGISARSMKRYESDLISPPLDVAYRIATRLGISLDYLVGRKETSRVKPPGIDPRLSLVARTGDALPIGY